MDAPADTRARILACARELFHARSYADVGVQEICTTARVQRGSFYHFFPSKRDLALAVIEEFAAEWASGFVSQAFAPERAPLERLDTLIEAAYAWQQAAKDSGGHVPGCPLGNLALEVSTQDDVLRAKLGAVFTAAGSRFRETIDQAVARGEFEPVDAGATANAMLAYLEGVLLLAKTRNDPELVRRLGPAIKTLRVGNK